MPSWLPLFFLCVVTTVQTHQALTSECSAWVFCVSKGQDAASTVGLNDPYMCTLQQPMCTQLNIFLQAGDELLSEDETEINASMLEFNIRRGLIVWWADLAMGWEAISDFYFNSLYWFNWGNLWTGRVSEHHIRMTICYCFSLNSQDVALQLLKWWMHTLLNMEMKVQPHEIGSVLLYMSVWQLSFSASSTTSLHPNANRGLEWVKMIKIKKGISTSVVFFPLFSPLICAHDLIWLTR